MLCMRLSSPDAISTKNYYGYGRDVERGHEAEEVKLMSWPGTAASASFLSRSVEWERGRPGRGIHRLVHTFAEAW